MDFIEYTRVWFNIPVTEKTLIQLIKIWREFVNLYGGGTWSRITKPSIFRGRWFNDEKEEYEEEDIGLAFFDVNIKEYPNFTQDLKSFLERYEGKEKELGEQKIWLTLENIYLAEKGPEDKLKELNERQREAWKHVLREGFITSKIYREINKISEKVAREELREITEKNLLKIVGKGRATRYIPVDD